MTATTAIAASPADFCFHDSDDLSDLGGPASRFNHNVAAITLLKRLEAESRAPGDLTRDEQYTLARYTGWGDSEVLKRASPGGTYSWARPCDELAALLNEEEIKGALGSTLNAHYTALPVIRAIYAALERSGLGLLSKLSVLEPAAGAGHFFGAMPDALALKSERVAVELDSLTGRILRCLYPETKVFIQGYETTALPQNYFDLIVSNVPFGNYGVHDPQVKQAFLKAAIHDYYFARSLALARPGGVIVFITSRYTLDKANARVRRYLAERAELLAAARLPEGAFRKNAGTEVVADVVILRKRPQPVEIVGDELNWIELGEIRLKDHSGEFIAEKINGLYASQPQFMLGAPAIARGMYSGDEFTLRGDGRDLATALREALIAQLPSQALTNSATAQPVSTLEDSSVEKESAGAVKLERLSGIPKAVTEYSVSAGVTRITRGTTDLMDGLTVEEIIDNNSASQTYGLLLENKVFANKAATTPLRKSKTYWEVPDLNTYPSHYGAPRPNHLTTGQKLNNLPPANKIEVFKVRH